MQYHQSAVEKKCFYGKKINFTKVRLEKIQVTEHLEGWDSGILKILLSASFSFLEVFCRCFEHLELGFSTESLPTDS